MAATPELWREHRAGQHDIDFPPSNLGHPGIALRLTLNRSLEPETWEPGFLGH